MATKREELAKLDAGEGCLGKAADDEPIFILRGQDMLSEQGVRDWANRAESVGCSPEKVKEARQLADKMAEWPNRKNPD